MPADRQDEQMPTTPTITRHLESPPREHVVAHNTPSKTPISRSELRDTALESRNRYRLGLLPNNQEGAEIDQALQQEADEESTIGIAYKFLVIDDIPDETRINALTQHLDNKSTGTAIGLRQHLDALRFGIFPQGPSMARLIAVRMKNIVHKHLFTDSTRKVLERNIAELERIASDSDVLEDEQNKAEEAEKSVTNRLHNRTGVYVFTYPHYLLHPTHPSKESEKMPDRTLLKVGYADNGILGRVNQETSGTGVPEHRRVLRAYLTPQHHAQSGRYFEKSFHDLLDSAGHAGPKRGSTEYQRGGKEWFYSNIEFLDRIADVLGLEIVEIDTSEHEL